VSAAPACETFAEELVAYLDGEQPVDERARIDAHVGSCLTCRRELDRLRRVRTLMGELRPLAPSPDFAAGMWRRLEATPSRASRWRAVVWSVVPLAAAAVVALAWYSSLERAGSQSPIASAPATAPAPAAVAKAPAAAAPAEDTRVAGAQPKAEEERGAREVASAPDFDDYPPELVEHPELFLRYPVVRRLRKLEHFEQVRERSQPAGEGERQPLG
jgi:anti-sigma factor RsiW